MWVSFIQCLLNPCCTGLVISFLTSGLTKYKISNKLHFPVIIGFNFSVSGGKEVWVRSAWARDAPRFLPLGDASAAVDCDKVDVPWVEAERIERERVSRTVVRKLTFTDRLLGCIEHWIKSFTYFLLRTVSSGYAKSSLLKNSLFLAMPGLRCCVAFSSRRKGATF